MPGVLVAYDLVGRVLDMPTRIAAGDVLNARNETELRLDAPESAAGEERIVDMGGGWEG